MTWIKLDDKAPRHPKVGGLTDKAFRWWIKGLCYAGEFLTNGVLPPVFWKETPKQSRAELTQNRLWDWDDPNFLIHDYHHHQSLKEDVEADKERNREKAKAYRDRRKSERRGGNALPSVTGNVTGNVTDTASPPSDRLVTTPENREQRTHTEIREQSSSRPAALVMSPLAYERRKQQCAFVGSRLEVPHLLHGELRKMLGGLNAEADLLAWYHDLDAEIEASGEAIVPDVFRWLKARFSSWAEAASEPTIAERAARIEAMVAARKAVVS